VKERKEGTFKAQIAVIDLLRKKDKEITFYRTIQASFVCKFCSGTTKFYLYLSQLTESFDDQQNSEIK
jgi:hypothetical protein